MRLTPHTGFSLDGRLSLSQRERIKVRDLCRVALQEPSKSLPALRPDFPGCRCCNISVREFLDAQGNDRAVDRVLAWKNTCDPHHRARSRVELQRNKNPGRNRRLDADGEICSRRNFDCAGGAKACVRRAWHFCEGNGRGSFEQKSRKIGAQGRSRIASVAALLPPHLNPLPQFGGEVGANDNMQYVTYSGAASRMTL
jgi:hypothetical protein